MGTVVNEARRWMRERHSNESRLWTAVYAVLWFCLIRPVLYGMDAEDAHHLAMRALHVYGEVEQ